VRVTILGSGTAIPSAERFPAGVLVRSAGATILVDAGPGVLRRLAGAGVGLEDLDAVLLTHFHVDHCCDLAALLFAQRNPRYAGRKPLALFGGTGFHRLLADLRTVWPRHLESTGYDLAEHEIGPGSFAVGDLLVSAVAVRHRPESLAYRIEDRTGASVAVSGDSDECSGLVEAARGADLFVCEASTASAGKMDGHLTAALAGRAAADAGARTLCLTHVYPPADPEALAAEARAVFPGEVVPAHDLMELAVRPGGG